MKFKRLLTCGTAVAAVVAGLSLATSGPAAAADLTGVWRPFGNTSPIVPSESIWVCGPTDPVATDVIAQACGVRGKPPVDNSRSSAVQAAVIVRNNRSTVYAVEAAAELDNYSPSTFINRWICPSSGVAPHSWSVCFGTTINHGAYVVGRGGANGVSLDVSANL